MSEWWTYRLQDLLLFSPRTYHRLFELYNAEVWPLHIVMLALGCVLPLLWRHENSNARRAGAAALAACWLWVTWAFHWQRYAAINWAASGFALAFAAEAALLLRFGWVLEWPAELRRWRVRTGLALYLLAVFAFPLIAPLQGRACAEAEVFGLMPDPTAIATIGLVLGCGRPARWLLPLPVAWCLVSAATLWALSAR